MTDFEIVTVVLTSNLVLIGTLKIVLAIINENKKSNHPFRR
ncbi:hypothetical protein [Halobacillus sp. A1]|nr:hypothetical protein [Halobacillus sp. A1]